jgi:hypothetical protein
MIASFPEHALSAFTLVKLLASPGSYQLLALFSFVIH